MNEIVTPQSLGLSREDLPNSYIGRSVPRPNARKLVEGRATYTDDVDLPRLVHAAFYRSPHAHARIVSIDTAAALAVPGVVRVFTGADLAKVCDPWVAVLAHLKGMKSAPQYPLPLERATWQGEAVVAVVAESRAAAEDGVAALAVEFEPLPAQVDMETALSPARWSSIPSSATIWSSPAPPRQATSPAPSPRRTRWWKRPSTPAAIPA